MAEQNADEKVGVEAVAMWTAVGQMLWWISGKEPDLSNDHLLYLRPQQAAQVPLNEEQRAHVVTMWKSGNWTAGDIIDAVEAAHGITGKDQG